MAQLVDHHVIDHLHRRQDQAPRKAQRSLRAARTPARPRRPDAHLLVLKSVSLGDHADSLRQYLFCPRPVPAFKDLFSLPPRRLSHPKTAIKDEFRLLPTDKFQRIFLSQIEECLTRGKFPLKCRCPGAHLLLVLPDPARMFPGELPDQLHRHPERCPHGQRPILLDHQRDCLPPCPDDPAYFNSIVRLYRIHPPIISARLFLLPADL